MSPPAGRDDRDGRVEEFLLAPVAAAMFVLADDRGLDAERLTEPATAAAMASTALHHLNPWSGEAAEHRARFLDAVRGLRPLVEAVVTDPRNAWWSAPLDRDAQLWLVGSDESGDGSGGSDGSDGSGGSGGAAPADPMRLPVPTGPIDHWEAYAQKPLRSIATSTELAAQSTPSPSSPSSPSIRSGAHAELGCGSSDWSPAYPVRQARLRVAATARVIEIHSAADWHHLVLSHGDPATHPGSDPNLFDSAGIDNGLAPTWSAVAADHDGVHLTFAGLLTALYVPVTTGATTTTLWAWEWESTRWLRPVFTAVTPLPDLTEPPRASDDLY